MIRMAEYISALNELHKDTTAVIRNCARDDSNKLKTDCYEYLKRRVNIDRSKAKRKIIDESRKKRECIAHSTT